MAECTHVQRAAKQARGQLIDDERELWRTGDAQCVMISCCSGAELQVRRAGEVVVRELYPTKSDLYERARDLKTEYEGTQRPQS
jgi:hypothetical protein